MNLFSCCTSTTEQGNVGFTHAKHLFTRLCYPVSNPIEGASYDLIIDYNGLKRIQIKTCDYLHKKEDSLSWVFSLASSKYNSEGNRIESNNHKGNVDFYYLLTANEDVFLVPDLLIPSRKLSLPYNRPSPKYDPFKIMTQGVFCQDTLEKVLCSPTITSVLVAT